MWIALGLIVIYFAIGAKYSRSQAVSCYKAAREAWHFRDTQEASYRGRLLLRLLFWPCYLVWHVVLWAFYGLTGYLGAPVERRRERVKELHNENLRLIDAGLANKDDAAYCKILTSLIKANDELIKELEI